MTNVETRPLPEALSRHDVEARTGEWNVDQCAPTRGLPVSSVEERFMRVPYGDDELSRTIRAHEMIHAKVSPRNLKPWFDRGIASRDAMTSVEEVRVNYLASRLGYDMKCLVDGSETTSGERAVATNDWRGAVMFAVGTAGTGGNRKFITGVRRHNKVWADILSDVSKRTLREIKKIHPSEISSTRVDETSGLTVGFGHVERIAEWVDRLAGNPPEPPEESGGEESGKDESESTEASKPRKRGRPRKEDSPEASKELAKSRKVEPSGRDYSAVIPNWFPLRVGECPLPDVLSGSLGKRRVASVSGKSPRRIHRMVTDPQRRVFDRTVKGKGGIVVIDCSGSMSLTREKVRQIVMASPGCTVLAYTVSDWALDSDGVPTSPNAWVLATKGRICAELPFRRGAGNGTDLPALQWAVAQRKRASETILWVCDGDVTGYHDNSHEVLSRQAGEFVKKHRIAVVRNTESAIDYLKRIDRGEKPTTKIPPQLTRAMD